MTLKCKPGDLALVIQEESCCQSNVGRMVRVRGPVQMSPRYGLDAWLIKPIHPDPWAVIRTDDTVVMQRVGWHHSIEHPDAWLLPIRPKSDDPDRAALAVTELLSRLVATAPADVTVEALERQGFIGIDGH